MKRYKDFLNENSNLDKSVNTLSKFGMFPKDELIKRIESLLTDEGLSQVEIFDDRVVNMWFNEGSSLISTIKKELNTDELIKSFYNLDYIGFENQGPDHVYVLYIKGMQIEEEKPTVREIAQDIVDSSNINNEDLENLEDRLEDFLPNSQYPVEEKDYKEIIKHIFDIMDYDDSYEGEYDEH